MITRFDHAVVAVPDLEAAMRAYRALGFEVSPGGRHPGQGTHNAIIRFGLDYIELLGIADEGEARAQGLNRQALLAFLDAQGGGLAGYALATDTIAEDAERLRGSGLTVEGPFAMQRQRPDGSVLAWQLAVPGGTPWRRPWPFLIAWGTPDAERLARERPGTHANGLAGVAGVSVAVRSLDASLPLYRETLGLTLIERDRPSGFAAERAVFDLGRMRIELLAPVGDVDLSRDLEVAGEGLYEVLLATRDLEATRTFLAGAGIPTTEAPGRPGALLIGPEAALGARLVIVPGQ